jgi:hypothetical protein
MGMRIPMGSVPIFRQYQGKGLSRKMAYRAIMGFGFAGIRSEAHLYSLRLDLTNNARNRRAQMSWDGH